MTKYIIKRILLMFLTLFIITVMCFVLIKLLTFVLNKAENSLRKSDIR